MASSIGTALKQWAININWFIATVRGLFRQITGSNSPLIALLAITAASDNSSQSQAKMLPRPIPPSLWSARPTLCNNLSTERGLLT